MLKLNCSVSIFTMKKSNFLNYFFFCLVFEGFFLIKEAQENYKTYTFSLNSNVYVEKLCLLVSDILPTTLILKTYFIMGNYL